MEPFRATRLAPSPTGALHLGHARTFLITWWLARQSGAKIYMRMEDIDAGRAKPESVAQAYEDLRWLGMDWDAFEGAAEIVQSKRLHLYADAVEQLWRANAAYPCVCTRADIAASVAAGASAPHEGEGHPRYPGTCRGKYRTELRDETAPEIVARISKTLDKPACFRLLLRDGIARFHDAIAGDQLFDVGEDAGDFPITRFAERHAALPPAYQLACVVDDHAMGIDMVIRGDDLLPSTPRQILLHRALGYQPPRFAHVPLVVGTDGKRLAKRHGESRIAQFREAGGAGKAGGAGVSAERVVGWVAWRSGQVERPVEMRASEMVGRFDLARLSRERFVLQGEDLEWLGDAGA